MFSLRANWDLTPNRLIESLELKRAAGVDVLDLTESNPTDAGFKYDEPGILDALSQPESMLYQPSPRGLLTARKAIADYYRSHSKNVDPESILLTASTSEAYGYLFKLLTNPGDEILIPQPGYPLFDFLAGLECLQIIHYPLRYSENKGWQIDIESMRALISNKTAAIIAINPNNPTGSYIKEFELDSINKLCNQYQLALIVDEVFLDYGYKEDSDRAGTVASNNQALTFVLSGLSKVLGLPQVKLGWIQVNGPEPLCSNAQERLEFIADTYLSVATPVQLAAKRLLDQRDLIQTQILARIQGNGHFLKTQCGKLADCRMLTSEGGWYAVIEMPPDLSDEEIAHQLLDQEDVFIHPGYFYGFEKDNYLIVCLLTPTATFQEGISRIISRMEKP